LDEGAIKSAAKLKLVEVTVSTSDGKVDATGLEQLADRSTTNEEFKNYLKASSYRLKMQQDASSFRSTAKTQQQAAAGRCLLIATGILGRFNSIGDDEMGQLYWQFTLFDLDKDGYITLPDLLKVVAYIDPAFSLKPDFEEKCRDWFGRRTFYPNDSREDKDIEIKVDFETYVAAVYNFRTKCAINGIYDNINFPFWSLRDCIVYTAHRHMEGWAWERNFGSWTRRHYRMCKDDQNGSNITLESYLDDKTDSAKYSVDLRDLISVTFSPKTTPPSGKDIPKSLVVFKLLFSNGKRYTLASDEDTAMRWTGIFSWYACGGRLILEWRIQYGDVSKNVITVRDRIQCAACIVNLTSYLDLQKKYKETVEDAVSLGVSAGKAAAKLAKKSSQREIKALISQMVNLKVRHALVDIVEQMERYYQTPRQRLIMKVCGIREDQLGSAFCFTQFGIMLWRSSKGYLYKLDEQTFFGGIRAGVYLLKNAVTVYRYNVAAKNSYKQIRYGIEWQDKLTTRECSMCKDVFSSFAIRSEYKKHHCRSCGRVVCHACSTHSVYFEVVGKVKRVCDDCLLSGAPPKHVDPMKPKDFKTVKYDITYR
jgi:hypothetical protein